MFCKNCGTDNLDTARFCVGCGTDLTAAPAEPVYEEPAIQEPVYQEPVYQAPEAPEAPAEENAFSQAFDKAADFGKNYVEEAKKDKKKLLIPIIAVAATLTLIIALIAFGGGGYKKALNPYEKILNGKASEKTVEKMMPKDYWEYMDDEYDTTPEDLYDMIDENYDDMLDEMEEEYGENVKVSFKVVEKDKLSEKKLDDLKDTYKECGMAKKNLTKAYKLKVEVTIKGSDDKDTEKMTMIVFKYKGKWYTDMNTMDLF